jgi:hypothetical protein
VTIKGNSNDLPHPVPAQHPLRGVRKMKTLKIVLGKLKPKFSVKTDIMAMQIFAFSAVFAVLFYVSTFSH